MDANSLQSMSAAQKDELMRTVQAQVALANMQEILSVSEWPKGMAIGCNQFIMRGFSESD